MRIEGVSNEIGQTSGQFETTLFPSLEQHASTLQLLDWQDVKYYETFLLRLHGHNF